MTRDKAVELLREYIKSENMFRHSLASEAVMRGVAARLNEDVEKWGLAGLLHDIDVEITNADPLIHGKESVKILTELQVSPDVIEAIGMHNEYSSGEKRSKLFHYALAASETITGLITATALVYPDRKVSSVKTKSIVKRMKEKAFAASVKRENILECELIGLSLPEFAEIAINAMSGISEELGL